MPHMRIALGDASPSVSDYAASFDTPIEPAVDRDETQWKNDDLLQYTCWLVANSLRNIVKQVCWHQYRTQNSY